MLCRLSRFEKFRKDPPRELASLGRVNTWLLNTMRVNTMRVNTMRVNTSRVNTLSE